MITASLPLTGNEKRLDLSVEWQISAEQARRKVARYFAEQVSTSIGPRAPGMLVICDPGNIVWRFAIDFGIGRVGNLGTIGEVDVDAITGDLRLSRNQVKRMTAHAEQLISTTHHTGD